MLSSIVVAPPCRVTPSFAPTCCSLIAVLTYGATIFVSEMSPGCLEAPLRTIVSASAAVSYGIAIDLIRYISLSGGKVIIAGCVNGTTLRQGAY